MNIYLPPAVCLTIPNPIIACNMCSVDVIACYDMSGNRTGLLNALLKGKCISFNASSPKQFDFSDLLTLLIA